MLKSAPFSRARAQVHVNDAEGLGGDVGAGKDLYLVCSLAESDDKLQRGQVTVVPGKSDINFSQRFKLNPKYALRALTSLPP